MADTVHITQANGVDGQRNTCASCAAAQTEPRGQLTCRRNPPGRAPSGISIWPTVEQTDWCMQWSPIE